MFNEAAKTFLELLKLAPRYLIALGIMVAFLLFAEEQYLASIGVSTFAKEYRTVLGLVLVVSGALFIVYIGVAAIALTQRWWRQLRGKRSIVNKLSRLNEGEKQILRYYYALQTRANYLHIDDGVVQELVAEGIIYRSASMGSVVDGFAHNISDIAWDHLQEYPHLLEGSTNIYRTDKKDWRF